MVEFTTYTATDCAARNTYQVENYTNLQKMIINGNLAVSVPAHLNFGQYVLDHLRNAPPNNVCLEYYNTGERLTFKQFAEYAVNLSVALSELGVKRGDTVGVGCEKRIIFLPTTLAIVFTGAAYTAFSKDTGRAVLLHQLSLSKPSFFICSELFWKTHGHILKQLRYIKVMICMDEVEDIELSINKLVTRRVDVESFEPATVQGQTDVAFISYSSGTTGMPKAVLVTHLGWIVRVSQYLFEDEQVKVALIFGEWEHSYDIYNSYNIITAKKTIIFIDQITPEVLLRCILDRQVNAIATIPRVVGYLGKDEEVGKHDLGSLKMLFSAACPLNFAYVEMVKKRFPSIQNVFQIYGMTEFGEITSERWNTKGLKPESVGMAAPGVSIKIIDPKTRKILGPGQRGEICVRGPAFMTGYIGVDSSTYMDEEGFFLTGDLGYYDEDRYFFIVGRLKEILCYDGFQVTPFELESILMQHPDVSEACVVGKPAGELGEEPAAFVVRAAGACVTEDQLVEYVSKEVPSYMQLGGGVKFILSLPKDARGKVQRNQLTQMLNEH